MESLEKVFNRDYLDIFILFSSELEATRQASGNWQNTPGSSGPAETRRRIHTTALSRGIPVIGKKIKVFKA